MQPEAPSAQPPAAPNNSKPQYDFIFNPNEPTKKSLLPSGSKKMRILVVGVGAILLIMLVVTIVGILNNAGKADTEALISAAKQQQELIRVANIGVQKATGTAAKNIAVTTKLALESEQDEMQAAIKTAGTKLSSKDLAASRNAKTDELLTSAEQNNRFDEQFLDVMTSSLKSYQRSVQVAYDGAKSQKLKAALTNQFKSANTLAGVASSSE